MAGTDEASCGCCCWCLLCLLGVLCGVACSGLLVRLQEEVEGLWLHFRIPAVGEPNRILVGGPERASQPASQTLGEEEEEEADGGDGDGDADAVNQIQCSDQFAVRIGGPEVLVGAACDMMTIPFFALCK